MEADHIPDMPTPKRQKMWDSEPGARRNSEKWVKSREMSQIAKWKNQSSRDYVYWKSLYHFKL